MIDLNFLMNMTAVIQVLAMLSLIVGIVTSIWSLILLKREVILQNSRIIELLEVISLNTSGSDKN